MVAAIVTRFWTNDGIRKRRAVRGGACALAAALALAGFLGAAQRAAADPPVPTPAHVVVVIMENHSFREIIGNAEAPYTNQLAAGGAVFTQSFAVGHPSEPNYFALFSGSTQGATSDDAYNIDAPTLASALHAAGDDFLGYVEKGSPRKHDPWESFAGSAAVERDLSAFPREFSALPTVSFVIPDLDDDMHNGSVAAGDAWLRRHIGGYADWCRTHASLLIVTFDEDDDAHDNRVPTLFFGAQVKPGRYDEHIDHYAVLRTVEAMYGLKPLGLSAARRPITDVWR